MKTNPGRKVFHRRSIRLKEYDYASEGGYFVTLVAFQRLPLFGEIEDGVMTLSAYGRIAQEEWFATQRMRPNVELLEDEFVVMPNHIHGIIWLHEDFLNPSPVRAYRDMQYGGGGKGDLQDGCGTGDLQDGCGTGDLQILTEKSLRDPLLQNGHGKGTARRALTTEQFGHPKPGSLATIVGAYKSAVTKRINQLRGTPSKTVWLRNYYEHIICTEKEYENIANYIADNPANWESKDEYHM